MSDEKSMRELVRSEGDREERELISASQILIEPIWEIQPQLEETQSDYLAFLIYANMHPGSRSIAGFYRRYTGRHDADTATDQWYKKVARFYWRERADAWDIHRIKESEDSWIERDQQRRDHDYQLGATLKNLAEKSLLRILENNESLTPSQIARFAELGARLQKESVPDIDLDETEIDNMLSILPDDKRKRVLALLAERVKK